jgi:DNA invertase Pin-like site-specific DNA recombinase
MISQLMSLTLRKFERSMIRERVRAGLARAKSEGKRLGKAADTAQDGRGYP